MNKTIIYGAGILAAVALLSKQGVKPYDDISVKDKGDALKKATDPAQIGKLLSDDKSPVAFVGNDYSKDEQTLLSQIEAIGQKYSNKVDEFAKLSNVGTQAVLSKLGFTLGSGLPKGYVITEKGMELYFKSLGMWLETYVALNKAAFDAFAALNSLPSITTCVLHTYVKEVDESASQSTSTWFTNSVRASSFKVAFGILGGGGSSTSTTSAGSLTTRNESRRVSFIQHCEREQVDPAKYEAALASNNITYKVIIQQVLSWFQQAPDPLVFATKENKDLADAKAILLSSVKNINYDSII